MAGSASCRMSDSVTSSSSHCGWQPVSSSAMHRADRNSGTAKLATGDIHRHARWCQALGVPLAHLGAGAAQNELAQRNDQPAALGYRDELCR